LTHSANRCVNKNQRRKEMKKRLLAILACVCLVAGLLAACGGTPQQAESVAAEVESAVEEAASELESEVNSAAAEEVSEAAEAASEIASGADELLAYTGDPVTLTLTSHDPETSATGKFLNDFAAKVSEMSDGLITIDVYHGGTLAGPKDSVDAVTNGSVDIAWGMLSFYDGMFPASEVALLPGLDITSAEQASRAIWDLYNTTDYMTDEFANWHVLLLHCNCQTPLTVSAKSSKQPEAVADLAGLTCRANAGPPTMLVEELGMTPKGCAINDLYSNLEKGEMDTALTDWHGVSSFKIDEVASKFMDEDFGTMCYFLLMNPDSYASLDPVAQTIIDVAASESIPYTAAWDDVQDEIKAKVEAAGQMAHFTDEDVLADKEKAVCDAWIAKTENGQEIYDAFVALLATYKK
jgi:TRAP-type C4-dicarboxylate transport system substrate-binding protein